jgi:flavin reductase (DIM6/NTAB) family NADH-FMN oxidoreductase RutF
MPDSAVARALIPPVEAIDDPDLSVADCLAFYRRLAAGVTVVTAGSVDGPVGATASSVTSVSLRPPLLLACLSVESRTMTAIRARGTFAVHLLAENQRHISTAFAARDGYPGQRFAGYRFRQVLGVPVLIDAPAWAVCLLADLRRYGDHDVAVGRLVAAHSGPGRPLLWHDRGYWRISHAGLVSDDLAVTE